MAKTKEELLARQREINARLGDLEAMRETTEAQKSEMTALDAEFKQLSREIEMLRGRERDAQMVRENRIEMAAESLRELLLDARSKREGASVEVTPTAPVITSLDGEVRHSGAVNLTIKDLIPTLQEGLKMPSTLKMTSGVIGDVLYPVSIDDVIIEEVGENVELNDQKIDFDQVRVVQGRTALCVSVSNAAIDHWAAGDLMALVQEKIRTAIRRFLAEKVYSQAAFTGIKGPFSGLTPAGNIKVNDTTCYASILNAVATFADKGFNADAAVFVIDAKTEAQLKACPKAAGQGGFVIENGKLAGYEYVVSHYINTTLNSDGKLTPTTGASIGLGFFEYLPLQQHGTVRMSVDATSKEVAKKNETAVVLNTAFSITDLSKKINGGNSSGTTQAFALYTVKTN